MAHAGRSLLALRLSPPRMTRRLIGALALAVVVLAWWLATLGADVEDRLISPVILPSPIEVLRSFPVLLKERALLQSIAFDYADAGLPVTLLHADPGTCDSRPQALRRLVCNLCTARAANEGWIREGLADTLSTHRHGRERHIRRVPQPPVPRTSHLRRSTA